MRGKISVAPLDGYPNTARHSDPGGDGKNPDKRRVPPGPPWPKCITDTLSTPAKLRGLTETYTVVQNCVCFGAAQGPASGRDGDIWPDPRGQQVAEA